MYIPTVEEEKNRQVKAAAFVASRELFEQVMASTDFTLPQDELDFNEQTLEGGGDNMVYLNMTANKADAGFVVSANWAYTDLHVPEDAPFLERGLKITTNAIAVGVSTIGGEAGGGAGYMALDADKVPTLSLASALSSAKEESFSFSAAYYAGFARTDGMGVTDFYGVNQFEAPDGSNVLYTYQMEYIIAGMGVSAGMNSSVLSSSNFHVTGLNNAADTTRQLNSLMTDFENGDVYLTESQQNHYRQLQSKY